MPRPGTGPRPGGWETLLYGTRRFIAVFSAAHHLSLCSSQIMNSTANNIGHLRLSCFRWSKYKELIFPLLWTPKYICYHLGKNIYFNINTSGIWELPIKGLLLSIFYNPNCLCCYIQNNWTWKIWHASIKNWILL